MSALLAPPPPSRLVEEPGHRIVLEDMTWDDYETFLRVFDGRRAIRLTYDCGSLEIMTLSAEHEEPSSLFDILVIVMAEEMNVPIKGYGSTTYKKKKSQRGLEPDKCYYTRNLSLVRGKKRIDLTVDPPPDLALEVDITSSSLNRMAIYASLGVPELWRYDGATLTVYQLVNGQYVPCERSPTFPLVPPADLVRFVRLGEQEDTTSMIRAFRTWLREQMPQHA